MKKIVLIITLTISVLLCGCVLLDDTDTVESDIVRSADTVNETETDAPERLIDESETETEYALIIITDTETETEAETEAETTEAETTVPETTKPETTAKETTAPETTVPVTTAPDTTKAPETTAKETTAEVTTAQDKDGIKITGVTSPVGRNETATVSINGKPNTEYTIKVYYSTTASKASGLEKKTSGADGLVSWSWKVGGSTKPGTFKIVISGGGEKIETSFTVN